MDTIFDRIDTCIKEHDTTSLQEILDCINMDMSEDNVEAITKALSNDDPETSLALCLCKQTFTCADCEFFSACVNGYSTWLAQEKMDPRDIDASAYQGGACA